MLSVNLSTLSDVQALPVSVAYIGETIPENWGGQVCDHWRATISGQVFDYFTGLGLRRRFYKNGRQLSEPVKPAGADILAALVRDADALAVTFPEWCAEYGYSADSTSAADIYAACIKSGRQLLRVFSPAQIAAISSLTAEL